VAVASRERLRGDLVRLLHRGELTARVFFEHDAPRL
jgi:hypothetical protein